MTPDEYRRHADSFTEIPMHGGGKRCGLQHTPHMGDWFTSWSPRNGNSNAEGPWDHWVELAINILQDPLTAIVRPEAHTAAAGLATAGFYDETGRALTDDEILQRFATPPANPKDPK